MSNNHDCRMKIREARVDDPEVFNGRREWVRVNPVNDPTKKKKKNERMSFGENSFSI